MHIRETPYSVADTGQSTDLQPGRPDTSRRERLAGVDLFRIWMCFQVIVAHFFSYNGDENLLYGFFRWNQGIAVGCFMFVSFLLTAPYLVHWADNPKGLSRRLRRISVPIVFWAAAYFVILYLVHFVVGSSAPTTADFVWQLLTGHSYNTPMYFMNDLLYLTLLFLPVLALKSKEMKSGLLLLLIAASFAAQYTGVDYLWFGSLPNEVSYPTGRFVELLPYGASALLIVLWQLHKRLVSHRVSWAVAFIALILLTWNFVEWPVVHDFGCGNFPTYIMSVALGLVFFLIPNAIFGERLRRGIRFVSNYTLGIYSLHFLMGSVLNNLFGRLHLPTHTLLLCVLTFVMCLAVCRLIAWLPWRWCREAVT